MSGKRIGSMAMAALGLAVAVPSAMVLAQGAPAPAKPPMTFFVSSRGIGQGGNLGGLEGADAHCQKLATEAGRGDARWHAYLSTQGPGAVNARDRIGKGPWHNFNGDLIASDLGVLNGDTAEQARIGNALGRRYSLSEQGEMINGSGDMPNRHDILTGSQSDGTAFPASAGDKTCHGWTSSDAGAAQLGHSDKQGGGNASWNSSHVSKGCSVPALKSTGGDGLLYCFAVN